MKRAYTKPKAKMVNFQYTERVVASGDWGRYSTGAGQTLCQFSKAGCTLYFQTGNVACRELPPENPGMPDPTI